MSGSVTLGELGREALPATVDTREAAAWLGVNYETLLDAANDGTAPVAPLRIGRRFRWPTALLLEALGVPADVNADVNATRTEGALRGPKAV